MDADKAFQLLNAMMDQPSSEPDEVSKEVASIEPSLTVERAVEIARLVKKISNGTLRSLGALRAPDDSMVAVYNWGSGGVGH